MSKPSPILDKDPRVSGQAVCDCGCTTFEVGIFIRSDGQNFIKLLECTACHDLMPVPFTGKDVS